MWLTAGATNGARPRCAEAVGPYLLCCTEGKHLLWDAGRCGHPSNRALHHARCWQRHEQVRTLSAKPVRCSNGECICLLWHGRTRSSCSLHSAAILHPSISLGQVKCFWIYLAISLTGLGHHCRHPMCTPRIRDRKRMRRTLIIRRNDQEHVTCQGHHQAAPKVAGALQPWDVYT